MTAMLSLVICGSQAQDPVRLKIETPPVKVISFQGVPSAEYRILTSTNASGPWITVATLLGTPTGYHAYTNFPTDANLFYRAVTEGGSVSVILDPASPPAEIVPISESQQTPGVLLATFGIKSSGVPGTSRGLIVNIATTKVGINELFTNIKIFAGGLAYSASSVSTNGDAIFENIMVPMPTNVYQQFMILGTVAQDVHGLLDGATAQVRLIASTMPNPLVVDSNNIAITVVPSTNTGSVITFGGSVARMISIDGNIGTPNISLDGTVTRYSPLFTFSFNAGNDPVYVSKDPFTLLSIWVYPGDDWTPTLINSTWGGSQPGDTSTYYIVPPGTTRGFAIGGVLTVPTGNVAEIKVTSINLGLSPTNLVSNPISYGLEPLHLIAP